MYFLQTLQGQFSGFCILIAFLSMRRPSIFFVNVWEYIHIFFKQLL